MNVEIALYQQRLSYQFHKARGSKDFNYSPFATKYYENSTITTGNVIITDAYRIREIDGVKFLFETPFNAALISRFLMTEQTC